MDEDSTEVFKIIKGWRSFLNDSKQSWLRSSDVYRNSWY